MKNYKDFVIVGIDHGYGNIKTANTVTPTGITKLDAEPTFSKGVLFYEGSYYLIGEGHKEFISDKWQDSDFYLFTLMGIARELNREGHNSAKVQLAVGLPLTWVNRQRDEFRKYMLQRESVDFKYEDKLYSVKIIGCYVFPQGYAAVVEKLKDMTGVNMLADIGNGTVNVMYINNRKPISTQSYTEKMGVNQCVISASNAVMDKLGVKIDESIIQHMIRHGKADIADEFSVVLKTAITSYANGIFDMLRRYEYNPKLMRLYITGGGGKLIENFGTYDKDRVTIMEDICASAKGYEQFAVVQLKKEGK
ncbi:MAG: ParM/StbA family protein [Ruminococcus sp.]|nr:ParM/StbA family protein [Ruminococcus sp.]